MRQPLNKIVFLGTPDFAVPFLQALIDNDLEPVLVITQPDEPTGRKQVLTPPPVKSFALTHGIKVEQPKKKLELNQILEKIKPDICVLVAYGMIISEKALTIPKFGFINVHPSLLPKYRGPAPVQSVILNGEAKTGVSIMLLDQEMDHGPILAQTEISILPNDTNLSLRDRLTEAGTKLLIAALIDYSVGKIKSVNQNHSQATFSQIIKRSDGQIDWQKSALAIDRQFRAFSPWPGVFTQLAGKRLKIANLSVLEGNFPDVLTPGELFSSSGRGLAVKCGQGAIELKTVQLEGKIEMSAEDFLRGYQNLIGKILN